MVDSNKCFNGGLSYDKELSRLKKESNKTLEIIHIYADIERVLKGINLGKLVIQFHTLGVVAW